MFAVLIVERADAYRAEAAYAADRKRARAQGAANQPRSNR